MSDESFLLNKDAPKLTDSLNSWLAMGNAALGLKRSQTALSQENLNLSKSTKTFNDEIARVHADTQTAQEGTQQQHLSTIRQQINNGAQQLAVLHGTGATPDVVKETIRNTLTNAGAKQDAIDQAVAMVPSDPAQIDRFIVQNLAKSLDASAQLDKIAPAPVQINNGQNTGFYQQGNPELTGKNPGDVVGSSVQQQLPPTTPTVDPETGQPGYLGAQKGNKNVKPPASGLPTGQGDTLQNSAKEVLLARSTRLQTPATIGTIDKIYNLANTDTKFGPGSETWQKVIGPLNTATGGVLGGSASNYQEAGAYLDRLTLQQAQNMGQNTVAGTQMAAGATGSPTLTKEALKEKMLNTRALFEGNKVYADALDKAVGTGPNPNFAAKQAFDAQWSNAYDTDLFRLKHDYETGNKDDAKSLLRTKPASYWHDKMDAMDALVPGYLPVRKKAQ